MLLTTGKVKQRALHRGHPEVGGASVKHHFELLRWSSNPNSAIVLSLQGGGGGGGGGGAGREGGREMGREAGRWGGREGGRERWALKYEHV